MAGRTMGVKQEGHAVNLSFKRDVSGDRVQKVLQRQKGHTYFNITYLQVIIFQV